MKRVEKIVPGGEPTNVKCNYIYPSVITFTKLQTYKPEGGWGGVGGVGGRWWWVGGVKCTYI